jgi:hypothetical protein
MKELGLPHEQLSGGKKGVRTGKGRKLLSRAESPLFRFSLLDTTPRNNRLSRIALLLSPKQVLSPGIAVLHKDSTHPSIPSPRTGVTWSTLRGPSASPFRAWRAIGCESPTTSTSHSQHSSRRD